MKILDVTGGLVLLVDFLITEGTWLSGAARVGEE